MQVSFSGETELNFVLETSVTGTIEDDLTYSFSSCLVECKTSLTETDLKKKKGKKAQIKGNRQTKQANRLKQKEILSSSCFIAAQVWTIRFLCILTLKVDFLIFLLDFYFRIMICFHGQGLLSIIFILI